MIIGVPREVKASEFRVGILPNGAKALAKAGNTVLVEKDAGICAGFSNADYKAAGARIVGNPRQLWSKSDLILKVKEPQKEEYRRLKRGQVLFCFLHLAPLPELTRTLIAAGVTAVAYETIETNNGKLPCLIPMSEIAGRMAVQIGAAYLMRNHGGVGLLLGGVPGVPPCEVLVLGGGSAGENAARLAMGMGARVTIMDVNLDRLGYIDDLFNGRIATVMSDEINLERYVPRADLLIGAVLVPGELAPKIVPVSLVKKMKSGAVIVDIAVDQGGCIATTHPTSHDHPVYKLHNVIHYAVPNMPGAVSKTSTQALANAVFPYVLKIAKLGLEKAAAQDEDLRRGINIYTRPGQAQGVITNAGVAQAFGGKYVPMEKAAGLK